MEQAFRPGNVDLPADQSHIANAETLNLVDRITATDLFAGLVDPDLLLSQPIRRNGHDDDPAVLDWGTQSLITDSLDLPQKKGPSRLLDQDDLEELDLGLGDDEFTLEVGRRAATPLGNSRDEPTLLDDGGLDLDFGDHMGMQMGDMSALPPIDNDITMGDLALDDTIDLEGLPAPAPERTRNTLSPMSDLSELRPSQERELERTFRPNETTLYDQSVDEVVAAQRVKRRKVLAMDNELELSSAYLKNQLVDHSKITKSAAFLPRDPLLLQLMNMQKSGGFVSSIFGDGRSMGWAPELRGVLSVDLIRSSGDLKRKRDSGVADLFSDEEGEKEQEEREGEGEQQIEQQYGEEDFQRQQSEGAVQGLDETLGDFGPGSPAPNFDDTTMPLLHPADQGPVSQGTKHAVHLLREHFGPEGEESESHRKKHSVLFQELLPETRSSRRDATKLFFEVLVLATKDAVKIEQSHKVVGEPIRIRAKRGLYGAWAEAGETQQPESGAGAVAAAA